MIATYFTELDMYFEERDDWATQYLNWQAVHRACKADCGVIGCGLEPQAPIEPNLKDYITEGSSCNGQVCPLSDVLNHTDGWRWIMP